VLASLSWSACRKTRPQSTRLAALLMVMVAGLFIFAALAHN
jgi:hypothetical protein